MARKKSLNSFSTASFRRGNSSHASVNVVCRILIVCEGKATEPNYFRAFNQIARGGTVYDISCEGTGFNTIRVVDKAIYLRDKAEAARQPYDSVWAVFDKDDFPPANFNAAIQKAAQNGINCAWSNESFELWYLYHFANITTPMSRDSHIRELTSKLAVHIKGFKYQKSETRMLHILRQYGDEAKAIIWAEKQANSFADTKYASHSPATTVYALVRLLRGEDIEFNRRIAEDISRQRF